MSAPPAFNRVAACPKCKGNLWPKYRAPLAPQTSAFQPPPPEDGGGCRAAHGPIEHLDLECRDCGYWTWSATADWP